jgi:hypothetical protein
MQRVVDKIMETLSVKKHPSKDTVRDFLYEDKSWRT